MSLARQNKGPRKDGGPHGQASPTQPRSVSKPPSLVLFWNTFVLPLTRLLNLALFLDAEAALVVEEEAQEELGEVLTTTPPSCNKTIALAIRQQ